MVIDIRTLRVSQLNYERTTDAVWCEEFQMCEVSFDNLLSYLSSSKIFGALLRTLKVYFFNFLIFLMFHHLRVFRKIYEPPHAV